MTLTSSLGCYTYGMDSRYSAVDLNKPNQQLRRDLKEVAIFLEDAVQALFAKAKVLSDAGFI